ncbi:MAG TPA: hypothetical protein VJJ20_02285 [Candidatus Paceibacterota bacterium]
MTSALALPSFKNSATGFIGLCLALVCLFAAAPQARAAGLTEPQISAILNLLQAFEVPADTIANVRTILNSATVDAPDEVGMQEALVVRAGESDMAVADSALALSCVLVANKASVRAGESVMLSWTSDNATKSGNGRGGFEAASGSKTIRVDTTTVFTKTVYGPGGKATCSTEVDVAGSAGDPSQQVAMQPAAALAALYSAYTGSINDTSDLAAAAIAAPFSAMVDSFSDILFNLGVY